MRLTALFLFASAALAQLSVVSVNVNVQVLSDTALKAKYRIKLPKNITAVSAVAENWSNGTMILGQGNIVAGLRSKGYPALGRSDAASVILRAQSSGFAGWILTNLPFAQKLLNDTDNLIVSGALHVAPGVGIAIAGTSAVINALAPDIIAQIQQFEQAYDTDGLQNLYQLGSGQSVLGTIILDAPPKFVGTPGNSFTVPVPVVQVTGQQTPQGQK